MKKMESGFSAPNFDGNMSVLKPLWERSPRKFWSAHEALIDLKLQEWYKIDPSLPLSKAVSRYVDGLPPDIPADILLKITEKVIEAWEKIQDVKSLGKVIV